MAGSDVPYTSFPGVVLKPSSSNKTVECKEKLEFSPYVYKSASLLTIVNFLYTSKVCTDNTVEQMCSVNMQNAEFLSP